MIDRAVAFRYAKVLFAIDRMKVNLEQRIVDFESILKILKDNPKLISFLHAPQVSLADKKRVLDTSLKGIFDPAFMNFLSYLIERKRLVYLDDIADAFKSIAYEELGIEEVDLVTAIPFDGEADIEAKLKQKLEERLGRKIRLNRIIDPKIIGGAILIISNKMLDGSVNGRLKELQEYLMTSVGG